MTTSSVYHNACPLCGQSTQNARLQREADEQRRMIAIGRDLAAIRNTDAWAPALQRLGLPEDLAIRWALVAERVDAGELVPIGEGG